MSDKHTETEAARAEFKAQIATVASYLQALEARDIEAAGACLAASVQITGPGGSKAASVEQIVANSARRYHRIGKHITHFDAMGSGDGAVVVYCMGTLHGEWPDGRTFTGIRFIDRFELRDGLITNQQVWNDAAEHRLRETSHTS